MDKQKIVVAEIQHSQELLNELAEEFENQIIYRYRRGHGLATVGSSPDTASKINKLKRALENLKQAYILWLHEDEK